MFTRAFLSSLMLLLTGRLWACELCAIYNADAAKEGGGRGFSLAIAEQYIPYGTVQLNGRELPPSILDQAFLDSSTTHVVPGWNFSDAFSLNLNLPIIHNDYKRFQLTGTGILREAGHETGIGDLALIARWRVIQKQLGETTFSVNLLGGVKFPTGDPGWVKAEVDSTRALDAIYGIGHQHSISGVHQSDLALGSGSYDGVMGLTANAQWKRLFCNAQFQYYLRTVGESDYRYGNEWMLSGGPGFFILLHPERSLSLQLLAAYDNAAPDTVLDRENLNSGMTAIYLGPQLQLALGSRFTANAGVDIPLRIENQGLQNVPNYRFHAGVSYRF